VATRLRRAVRALGRLGVAALWALALLSAGVPAGAREIKVGMSAAFSGPSRALGIELYRGALAYIRYANQRHLLGADRLRVIALDDGYQPGPAIQNTIELVNQKRVFLLFNYVGTPTVTRMLPLLKMYRRYPLYLLFPFTGAEPQRRPPYREYVFNLRASYLQETKGLVENLLATGRRRIAIFYQADAYGRSGWLGVRRALGAHGLKMVSEATYRRGDKFSQSFQAQVDILRRSHPQAVISVGSYEACAGFIRDARGSGWQVPIANLSFVDSDNLLRLLKHAAGDQQEKYTRNLIISQVVPSYEQTSLPAVAQYRRLMDRYDPQVPPELAPPDYRPLRYSFVSMEGFLNAKLLVKILSLMKGDLRRSRLPEVIEGIKDYDIGIGVPVRFGKNRHQGLDQVYYTTVRRGRLVPIRDWSHWRD